MALTLMQSPLGGTYYYENRYWKRVGDYLIYKGPIAKGHIVGEIPKGIKTTKYMFSGLKDLRYPPEIPEGVKDASYMFADTSILYTPELPDSIENATAMFINCPYISTASRLPENLKKATSMFANSGVKTCVDKVLPASVVDINYMFYNTPKLDRAPKIPWKRSKEYMADHAECYDTDDDIMETHPWYGSLSGIFGY